MRTRSRHQPAALGELPSVMYMVLEGPRDALGRASFTLFWSDPDGVFRNEPSNEDSKPVGYRRGQCFRAIPEDYIKRGAKLVESEAIAKHLAWHEP